MTLQKIGRFLSGVIAALALSLTGHSATTLETFDSDPFQGSWRRSGDLSLFQWNATGREVEVRWDSSRSNSFFWRPLGFVLTKADDFSVSFSLRIHEIQIGTTPNKPAEFPMAIGFLHHSLLTNSTAFRGAGISGAYGVRNIVEWNFFPDAGFGDTWATTVVSSNNVFAYAHTFPLELVPDTQYRITLRYTASDQVLRTSATRNGQSIGSLEDVLLAGIPDFRVEAFSVTSYSDLIQAGSPAFHGSIRARGSVDDVELTVPTSPISELQLVIDENGVGARFNARSNWVYTLERSVDLDVWVVAGPAASSHDTAMLLRDVQGPGLAAFYRVRAERP